MSKPLSIPEPLVKANQWFIVISVLIAWLIGFHWLIALPLLSGLSAILFHYNPVIKFGRRFLKKPMSSYIPKDVDEQNFNQKIAVTCLSIGFIASVFQWSVIFFVFTTMVALAAFIAILGFCIGCFIRFQWIQFRNRHASR